MDLKYNKSALENLMKYFHELTGILMTLYDMNNNIIASYPYSDCTFCKKIKNCPDGLIQCMEADKQSFNTSKKTGQCIIYSCHTGLTEATAPVIIDGAIIGYMMIGQISNTDSVCAFEETIHAALKRYNISDLTVPECIAEIPQLTNSQIIACTKIMEACISDIIYKNMISINRQNFKKNINQYLLTHLDEHLSIDLICEELHISRRKLYNYSNQYLQCSIGKHIKNLRIEQARKLLKETNIPITEISEKCGFADYNYFCRIFKKETGMPAHKYRKSVQ